MSESTAEQLDPVPLLIYDNNPSAFIQTISLSPDHVLKGIPASPGQAEGTVKVLRNFQVLPEIDQDTILLVPYTDSGWVSLLAMQLEEHDCSYFSNILLDCLNKINERSS